MIKIYFSKFNERLNDEVFFKFLNLIPQEIKEKILRLKKWEDRQASLFGKLLLKKGLKDFGKASDLNNLKYTKYGRPYLEDDLDFNISHSHCAVVCVISNEGKIGIDVEELKPVSIADFKNEFSNEEWNNILNSKNTYREFYYYWTAKEAAIKADGKGLNISPGNLTMKNNTIQLGGTVWFIKNILLFENYIVQLASEKPLKHDIELLEVSF